MPRDWAEHGKEMFKFTRNMIREDQDSIPWGAYLPIQKHEGVLLGTCGFKGKPNEEGGVEIGYEIVKAHRNRGYATEIARLLVEMAFQADQVNVVLAHTLAEENASVRVLKKNGFHFVEELFDETDGKIWKWKKEKSTG